jgi:L-lysine 2,3-aminomutase
VTADKTKYMVMSQDQNAGQSHNIKTDNSSIERVEELRYLGTALANQNSIQKEIEDCNQAMLAILRCRIFCLPVCYPDI